MLCRSNMPEKNSPCIIAVTIFIWLSKFEGHSVVPIPNGRLKCECTTPTPKGGKNSMLNHIFIFRNEMFSPSRKSLVLHSLYEKSFLESRISQKKYSQTAIAIELILIFFFDFDPFFELAYQCKEKQLIQFRNNRAWANFSQRVRSSLSSKIETCNART